MRKPKENFGKPRKTYGKLENLTENFTKVKIWETRKPKENFGKTQKN